MPRRPIQLKQQLQALKKDWAYLDRFDLPYDRFRDRSKVFIETLQENGATQSVYIKIYSSRKHPCQRMLRPSRSRQEVRNLLVFQALGLRIPKIMAWGERRNSLGKLIQDFIITRSIPDAHPLDEYLRSGTSTAQSRLNIARKLGTAMRRLHGHHFYHKDIHFRNILVTSTAEKPRLHFIDCPRGCFYSKFGPREHWRVKDLAILDKYASVLCSEPERCAFLENYLDQSRQSEAFGKEAETIVSYRKKRYDNRKGRTKVQPAVRQAIQPDE